MKKVLSAAAAIFFIDQMSKLVVVQWLDLQSRGVIEAIGPYLSFRMAWNRGVNFGLFSNDADTMRWVLVAVAVAVSAWLLNWSRHQTHFLVQIFTGFIIGGAFGNALDRLTYGAVADFLNVSCCGLNNPYAFNIADMAIFMGAFGLVLVSNKHADNR